VMPGKILDSQDDVTSLARELTVDWAELTDSLVAESLALEGGHTAPLQPIFARESNETYDSIKSHIGSVKPGLLADETVGTRGGAVPAVDVAPPALGHGGADQAGADWTGEEVEEV